MGIKGIYPELGPGKRVSLSKLAGDCLESKQRPYRIAVDVAIWQYQNQAARGGANPAIRTLFYRLVRLLATPVRPIFVFDGPYKPVLKRNRRSGRGIGFGSAMAKRLIRLFGFPVHDAPGEAEAECALLQRHGIVDAVLSEDVDTIMFGCTRTLRNWSAESKTATAPTHVSLYDVDDMKLRDVGLDREGMVLVALMSGGDYLPDGIPGCGVKVACEAAKAGFGKSVCRLRASDEAGIRQWRSGLVHELQTNEQTFFRTKHKKLVIPEDFPNLEVLGYYTRPVVSPESSLPEIRQKMDRKIDVQLEGLREFTRETFDWDYRVGAVKFVHVLGQALLVQKITDKADATAHHIKRISGRRTHFSTDGTPELRVSYMPEEVVPIDMAGEVDEIIQHGRGALALNSDDEFDVPEAVEDTAKVFDVTKPDLAWVLEGLVKTSAPGAFQQWQEKERVKAVRKSPSKKKKAGVSKAAKASADMSRGALDKYIKTTKATAEQPPAPSQGPSSPPLPSGPARPRARPGPSKQSSPSSAPRSQSPVKASAPDAPDRSPSTPRSRKVQRRPEAICISSSPPAASASPPPASSSSRLGPCSTAPPVAFRPDRVSEPVRARAQKGRPPVLKAFSKKASGPTHGLGGGQPQRGSTLKQSSMQMFVTKSKFPASAGRKDTVSRDADGGGGRVAEPGPAGTQRPSSAAGEDPLGDATSTRDGNDGSKERPSPKKKLLRPRLSAPGFYEEVELGREERDAQLAAAAGGRGVRWSDVSVIDLT